MKKGSESKEKTAFTSHQLEYREPADDRDIFQDGNQSGDFFFPG